METFDYAGHLDNISLAAQVLATLFVAVAVERATLGLAVNFGLLTYGLAASVVLTIDMIALTFRDLPLSTTVINIVETANATAIAGLSSWLFTLMLLSVRKANRERRALLSARKANREGQAAAEMTTDHTDNAN